MNLDIYVRDGLVLDTARQNTVQVGSPHIPLCCFYPPGQVLPALHCTPAIQDHHTSTNGEQIPVQLSLLRINSLWWAFVTGVHVRAVVIWIPRNLMFSTCSTWGGGTSNPWLIQHLWIFLRFGYSRAHDLSLAVTPYNIQQIPMRSQMVSQGSVVQLVCHETSREGCAVTNDHI